MPLQRQLFRIAIDRSGVVRRAGETFPCNVVDVTEKGVGLRMNATVSIGEELHLQFPLTDVDLLDCTIRVTYYRPPHAGAIIVRMPAEHQVRLAAFIDQLNELNMTGF